jgi:hypothetical protein
MVEATDPAGGAFMKKTDTALVKQVFGISKRERESDIHHHAKLADLGRSLEVAKWILGHFLRLNTRTARRKAGSFDNAPLVMGGRKKLSDLRRDPLKSEDWTLS